MSSESYEGGDTMMREMEAWGLGSMSAVDDLEDKWAARITFGEGEKGIMGTCTEGWRMRGKEGDPT